MKQITASVASGALLLCFSSLVYARTDFGALVVATLPGTVANLPTEPAAEVDYKAPEAEPLPLKPSREPLSTPHLIAAAAPLGSDRVSLIAAAVPLGSDPPAGEPQTVRGLPLKVARVPLGLEAPLPSPLTVSTAAGPQRTPRVGAPPWMKVASGPLATPGDDRHQGIPTASAPTEPRQPRLAVATQGSTASVLARIKIPLKDGSEATADRLLDVQERVWYWKGGSVRRQLARLTSVLIDTGSLDQATQHSGLTLNEVQYLLTQAK